MRPQRTYPKLQIANLGSTETMKARDVTLGRWMMRLDELWRVSGVSLIDGHVRIYTEGFSSPLIFPADEEVVTHENWSKIV